MPSKKAKKPVHLPDGRHVATVGSDELWCLYRRGVAPEDMVMAELARRKDPRPRKYVAGPSFSGGSQRKYPAAAKPERSKPGRPDRPSNVKDAKKDAKKGAEEK
jgi:hypothetical protein